MGKKYICFICYQYHPENEPITEKEFKAGNNICKEENCTHKGQPLNEVEHCDECNKFYLTKTHKHSEL